MNKLPLLFLAVCFSICSFGATFTVSNTNDAGAGSLRQAILDANASSAANRNITFSASGSLHLVDDLPSVNSNINIIGNVDSNNEPTFKIIGYARYYDWSNAAKDSLYGFLLNGNNIQIKNIWLENFYSAILLKNCNGVTITNNRVYKCYIGISTDTYDNTTRESANITIEQNKINWFKDPYFDNVSYNCNGNVVSNPSTDPRIIYFSWTGIYIRGKKYSISNNTIGYCRYGINTVADSITINNNSIGIDDKTGDPISFFNSSACSNDELQGIFTCGKEVKVLSNTIGNSTYGIETYYAPATPKTLIQNNRIGSDAFGNKHPVNVGLYLYEREHTVKNNIITNYTYRGIWLNGALGKNSRLIENTITSFYPNTVAIFDNNNLKAAPSILSYTPTTTTITVTGKSIAGDTVDVFTNNAAPENAIDFINYAIANASGDWQLTFNKSVFNGRIANNFIVSVGRDISGNSSILSAPFRVSSVPGCWVFNTNDSGPGSLREAVNCANSNTGLDTIKFDFSGNRTISLLSPLPTITDSTVIDGFSIANYQTDPITLTTSNTFPLLSFINCKGNTVRGLSFTGATKAIQLILVNNSKVYQNEFDGNSTGISIDAPCISNDVYSNTFQNITGNAVYITATSTKNIIRNNNFIQNNNSVQIEGGSTENSIQGNTITNSSDNAIVIVSGAIKNRVEDNIINNSTKNGIDIGGGITNTLIRNNTISVAVIGVNVNSGCDGTSIKNSTIEKCSLAVNIQYAKKDTLSQNTFSTNTTAVLLSGMDSTIIQSNSFDKNGVGIMFRLVNNSSILSNYFTNQDNECILNMGSNTCNNIKINDNYFGLSSIGTVLGNKSDAIRCSSAAFRNSEIINNVICKNNGYGIYIEYYSQNVIIRKNKIGIDPTGQVYPNKTGIYLTNASSVSIGDYDPQFQNQIVGNTEYGIVLETNGFANVYDNIIRDNGIKGILNTAKAIPRIRSIKQTNAGYELIIQTQQNENGVDLYLGNQSGQATLGRINTTITNLTPSRNVWKTTIPLSTNITNLSVISSTTNLSSEIGNYIDPLVVTQESGIGEGTLYNATVYSNLLPDTNRVTFNIPGTGTHYLTRPPISNSVDKDFIYLQGPIIIDASMQAGEVIVSRLTPGQMSGGLQYFATSSYLLEINSLTLQDFNNSSVVSGSAYMSFKNMKFLNNNVVFNLTGKTKIENSTFDGNHYINTSVVDSLVVKNSVFKNALEINQIQLSSSAYKRFENCVFDGNKTALSNLVNTVVIGSTFKNNEIGITPSSNSLIIRNTFDNNSTAGIQVINNSNKISQNIFVNGNNSIDLRLTAPTPGNSSKAFPTNLAVTGYRLTGKAAANDTVEIFAAIPGALQSATKYLGYVQADFAGNWTYNITGIDVSIPNGIVTTATDAAGNTSQLSAQVLVGTCTKLVTNIDDSGPGSFRACVECANANGGTDTIKFAIPGVGPYIIKPATVLPQCGVNTDDIAVLGKSQAMSGLGSGSQTIIIDWSGLAATNKGINMYRAEVRDIIFKSGALSLNNSKLINCVLDSSHVGITGYSLPSGLGGIIDSCIFNNNSSGISIGGGASNNTGSAKVTNCYFYNMQNGTTIGSGYSGKMIVENNFIGQDKAGNIFPVTAGISSALTGYSLIKNNVIYTDATDRPAIKLQSIQNTEILNNTIIKVGSQSSLYSLVEINSLDTAIIKGNTISNSYLHGIDMWQGKNIWIENNIIKGNAGNGIATMFGFNDSLYIRNNSIYSNGKSGIYITNGKKTIITNNNIGVNGAIPAANGLSGIYIYNSSIDSIANNKIENNKNGIILSSASPRSGKKAIVYQNTLSKNDTAIFITNSSNGLSIKNNNINTSGVYGIYMNNGSNAFRFESNTISTSGIAAVYGIGGISNNQFISNTISQNVKGIEFLNGSSNNIFLKNTFSNTQQNIILYNGAYQNKISQNKFISGDSAINLRLISSFGPGNNAKATPTNLAVSTDYVLTGKAGANDSIEIFAATPSLIQTAFKYLGHVKADASGNWTYNITGVDASITNGIVATATDASGNTSQLSGQVIISPCTKIVTNTNDSGPGSFRACIACANLNGGTDTIKFAIPGAGPYSITPLTVLPDIGTIYDSILVDGKTQPLSNVGSGNQQIIVDGSNILQVPAFNSTIQNIYFKKLNQGILIQNSVIQSCVFDTCNRAIVIGGTDLAAGSFYNKIKDCEFLNSQNGLAAFGSGSSKIKLKVEENYFYNINIYGIYSSYALDSLTLYKNVFGQNRAGQQQTINSYGAVSCSNGNTAVVDSNKMYTIFSSGSFESTLGFQSTRKLVITNNIFAIPNVINSQNVITVNLSDTLIIKNNNITGGRGMQLGNRNKYTLIQDNFIKDVEQTIFAYSARTTDELYIIGNEINGSKNVGISIDGVMKTEIKNNIIGNLDQTNPYPMSAGIRCQNGSNFTISNNEISYCNDGIATNFSKVIVKGNTIINNKFNGLNGYNASNSTIEKNIFRDNNIGINLQYDCNSNIILNNLLNNKNTNINVNYNSINNKISGNGFLFAPSAININRNTASPGNNNKDTATISGFVQTTGYIDLSGKGLNADTIEVFNGNGTKEQTTAYVNHTKVSGTDWTLRVPVNAGYNPVANNYYLVTATDAAGNTSQLSNFIKVPLKLLSNRLNVLPNDAGICLGDSTQLDAVAEDVTYYKWYNKTTGAVVSTVKMPYFKHGGDYVLEVGDSFGNAASDTIHIIENSLPLASDFLMASEAGILDNIVAIDISYTRPDSLVWNWGAATAVWDTDKYLLTFPATGTYTIGLTSYLGLCAKKTSHDIIIVPGKLSPDIDTIYYSTIVSLAAGPNPVTTEITFNAELNYDEVVTTYIYNLLGAVVYTYTTPIAAKTHNFRVDMSAVASGAYIVKVVSGTDQRVIKIIKQ